MKYTMCIDIHELHIQKFFIVYKYDRIYKYIENIELYIHNETKKCPCSNVQLQQATAI